MAIGNLASAATAADTGAAERKPVVLVLRDGDLDGAADFAFTEAATRGAELLLVDCDRAPDWADYVAWETGRQRELDEALAPWRDHYSHVAVTVELVGGPWLDLTSLADRSQVLVVV
jgi:hypothetical protein